MAKKKSLIPGFSLNRALGVTSTKQKIARATGIPTTKQGRKRKLEHNLWTAAAVGTAAAVSMSSATQPTKGSPELDEPKNQQGGRQPKKSSILIAIILLVLGCIMFAKGIYLLGIILPVLSVIIARMSYREATSVSPFKFRTFRVLAFVAIFPIIGSVATVVIQNAPTRKSQDVQIPEHVNVVTYENPEEWYYTEEEQEQAAKEYYEKVGYDPNEEGPLEVIEDGVVTYVPSSQNSNSQSDSNSVHTYIINKDSGVFHLSGCPRAKQINSENLGSFTGTRSEAIAAGYSPCGSCEP